MPAILRDRPVFAAMHAGVHGGELPIFRPSAISPSEDGRRRP
jgi:hypothetical protein